MTAVKVLAPHSELKASDMQVYAPGTTLNRGWGEYAKVAWQP